MDIELIKEIFDKDNLIETFKSLIQFIQNIVVIAFLFGFIGAPFIGISVLIPEILHEYVGIPFAVSEITSKILLTLSPFVPTLVTVRVNNDMDNDITDLAFAVWMLVAIYAWTFYEM